MGTEKQIEYVRILAEKADVDHLNYAALYESDHKVISDLINELKARIRTNRRNARPAGVA